MEGKPKRENVSAKLRDNEKISGKIEEIGCSDKPLYTVEKTGKKKKKKLFMRLGLAYCIYECICVFPCNQKTIAAIGKS